MRTDRDRSNMMGQASATLALILAVVALIVAIWAWTRADPELSTVIDTRVAEVRQEMTLQVDALQAEFDELRQQLVEDDADDDEDADEEDDEAGT